MAVTKKKESDWWNEFFPTARPIFGLVSDGSPTACCGFQSIGYRTNKGTDRGGCRPQKSVGFVKIEGFGSVKGEPISHKSRMIWLFGSKPG